MPDLLLALALASGIPHAVQATVSNSQAAAMHLSVPQTFRLAELIAAKGDFEGARKIYEALERNRDSDVRAEARFRDAKLLIEMKQTSAAAVRLRQILDEKPGATGVRLQLATLLDQLGDKEGAWRQIRAAQAAGLPPAVARLVDRYSEALRAQRAFGASFEVALAPDSNINRATRSDTLGTVLGDFEIDKDGKARSGTGLSLNGQLFRRLPLGSSADLLFRVSGFGNLYRQTQFNDIAADVAAGPELSLGRDRLQLEVGATQRWFGQKPFLRSARVGGTFAHQLGIRTLVRVTGSAAIVDNQMNDLQDGKVFSGQVGLERALSPTTGVAASFALDRQSLRDPGYSTMGWRAGLTAWRDMGRLTLTAGAEFGHLHADERLTLFPDRRADQFTRLSIGATFRQLQFGGFAPVARLSIERNRSSIAFYDYRRTRTEVGFVHAF